MLGDQVVHETLDGETVVINLASGTYYSLEGVAAELWSDLLAGESADDLANALAAEHGADAAAVLSAITTFQQRLFDEGLITQAPDAVAAAGGSLGTFQAPTVRSYDDLQEHLLLDPVHDVERGAGWPAVPQG